MSTARAADAQAARLHEFLEVSRGMRPALRSVALRIVRNEEDAADVVQDSYLSAWTALPGFRGDSRLSTWLHTIVVNRALTVLASRRRHHHEVLLDDHSNAAVDLHADSDPASAAISAAMRDALRGVVDRLPETSREVIILRELHGLSHEEIARSVGISVTASKVRLHRARLRLRALLADQKDLAIAV